MMDSIKKVDTLLKKYSLRYFYPQFPNNHIDLLQLYRLYCEKNSIRVKPNSFYEEITNLYSSNEIGIHKVLEYDMEDENADEVLLLLLLSNIQE